MNRRELASHILADFEKLFTRDERNRAQHSAWRAANLEKARSLDAAQARARRASNPERVRARERAWYAKTIERRHELARAFSARNAEKLRAAGRLYSRRYNANPLKASAKHLARAWNDDG
jgi:hypothetical protein